MEHNLLVMNILRTYLPITILVSLTSTVATFINIFLTGIWLGDVEVQIISVPSYLTLYISVTGSMVATGGSVIFSRFMAKGDRKRAANSYSIAIITAIVVGAIFMAVCIVYAYILLSGVETHVSDIINGDYIRAIGLSAIPLLMLQVQIMFLRMDNDRFLALTCFAVYIIIDIASVWFNLEAGNGSFGVGISVAEGSIAALLLAPIHRRLKDRNMWFTKPFELAKGLSRLSKIGFRSILNRVCMSVRYYFLKAFIVATGIGTTACLTAQNTMLHLVVALFSGCAIMANIMCGIFYQQGDRRAIMETLRELIQASLIISTIVAVLIMVLSEDIVDLLVSGEESRNSALWCLRWFCLSIPTTTLSMIMIYTYQATHRKVYASILVVYRSLLLLMLAVFLLAPALGEAAVWTSFILADLFALSTMVIVAWIRNRRFPRSIDDLVMIHGKRYENVPLLDMSIHNDRDELNSLISSLGEAMSSDSVETDTARDVLDRVERIIGDTIDTGYRDQKRHQIDIIVRHENGINITIRDDATVRIEVPKGVRHTNSMGLNIYYLDVGKAEKAS